MGGSFSPLKLPGERREGEGGRVVVWGKWSRGRKRKEKEVSEKVKVKKKVVKSEVVKSEKWMK